MNHKIGIIGLGYVGLPLLNEFSKKFEVFGYDINNIKIKSLKNGNDYTQEIGDKRLKYLNTLETVAFTSNINDIKDCNVFIVTVPTPITEFKHPDLNPLIMSTKSIGKILKKDDFVIYESTVYPGVTNEECIPLLEKESGLNINVDFFVGYSPERINPGDKINTLTSIIKVTSGSNEYAADFVDKLYSSIIKAGTFKVKSIKIAEATKAIENSQRDVNIAFINELSKIFEKLNIPTQDVLDAAATKWNFLSFKPGLVGGHCIGVDPYYLAQKAEISGYYPELILNARKINDSMGKFVSELIIKNSVKQKIQLAEASALILGFTFKENCSDYRNTKVVDIYKNLRDYNIKVDIYDPEIIDHEGIKREYEIELLESVKNKYEIIVLAVSHSIFNNFNFDNHLKENYILFDVKSAISKKYNKLSL